MREREKNKTCAFLYFHVSLVNKVTTIYSRLNDRHTFIITPRKKTCVLVTRTNIILIMGQVFYKRSWEPKFALSISV